MRIERLAIIGVGLIGGSLARALRAAGVVGEIVGCGRSLANLERARALGVVDHITHDPAEAVRGADMVFLAVPLGAMRGALAAMRDSLDPEAIITDGGSVKCSVIEDARAVFGAVPPRLVPGHPIAGTEHSGVEASFAELYRERRVILTPLPETDPDALARVTAMWQACGAEVTEMSVAHHDEVLAATSHLPHMLAFGLVDALARMRENDEIFRYAAGGFRDFTRIASSNPVMWRDICLANREALSAMLARFSIELTDLAESIRRADGEQLHEIFARARAARDRSIAPPRSSAPAQLPVVGFVAPSGSGKTTLLRRLVAALHARGQRVGYLKHAHHRFDLDRPGKDSYELRAAGAAQTLLASRERWALQVENTQKGTDPDLESMLARFERERLDLVLVEGFKHAHYRKIEVYRAALGQPPLYPNDPEIIALVTDDPPPVTPHPPLFSLADLDGLMALVLR